MGKRVRADPRVRIGEDLEGARTAFAGLTEVGIDSKQIFRELEDEGVKKFSDSFDGLMKSLADKRKSMRVA